MSQEPILIVDDNPMNRKLERVLLEAEDYKVLTAVDAEDALKVLRTFKPKLILMDLQLPGMDGVELSRRLKSDPGLKNIVILMVTSYDLKGQEERALAAGCAAYIHKPIDTRSLPKIVADCLRISGNAGHSAKRKRSKGN
jgi:CheY-like chemotaxis protein